MKPASPDRRRRDEVNGQHSRFPKAVPDRLRIPVPGDASPISDNASAVDLASRRVEMLPIRGRSAPRAPRCGVYGWHRPRPTTRQASRCALQAPIADRCLRAYYDSKIKLFAAFFVDIARRGETVNRRF